jgi:8-oxo-dGTP pyrophosphatase MutT (NUDIX family)
MEKIQLAAVAETLRNRTPGLMDATRKYAVLVPLVRDGDSLSVLYEVRAGTMRRQPGEVCFPGGRMEGAETPEACALRETQEELSIPPSQVQVLGQLDFIAHRANFILYPILGLVEQSAAADMRLNPDEVAETFQVPLSHLLSCRPQTYSYPLQPQPGADFPYDLLGISRDYPWQPGQETGSVYPWQGYAIWGLTGRITRHLVQILRETER